MRTGTLPSRFGAILALACLALALPARAEVYRVSTQSTAPRPDGLTWATAFKTVQAGLNACILGDEVWVAAGTYPEHFILKNGVALYGGFAGAETGRDQRNFKANVAVLDGGGTGTVVIMPSGATGITRLDGFTVQRGANGILCSGGAPTIANNRITGNIGASGIQITNTRAVVTDNTITNNVATAPTNGPAVAGAGIRILGGAPLMQRNDIAHNNAYSTGGFTAGSGGGVYCGNGADVTILDNTFAGNTVNLRGGGISFEDSTAIVQGCEFIQNSSKYEGPGLWAEDSTVTLLASAFSGNVASHGSGASFFACTTVVRGNTIAGNGGKGVGIHQTGGSIEISHNEVTGNNNDGVYLERAISKVDNNLLAGNAGAGLRISGGASTVWNNTVAANQGGGVSLDTSAHPTLVNNIVAFNAAGITAVPGSVVDMRFICVAGNTNYDYSGLPDQTGLNGNIRVNPQFADSATKDYHLTAESECLDAGDDSIVAAGTTDLDSRLRILGAAVDLGAYEYGIAPTAMPADVADALKILGGLRPLTEADAPRLNVDRGVTSQTTVDMFDVLWLARHAAE